MADEQFVLDGLDLQAGGLTIEEFAFPPPRKRLEWATAADADGAALIRDPLFENRTGTMSVRVLPSATMLAAAQRVAAISRKLEECEQHPDGLPLVWTPADGTVPAVSFRVLTGSITELPLDVQNGYFVKAPLVKLELTCKPFAYGAEVVAASASGTAPVLTVTVAAVPGDVAAEGRLIVTDAAAQDRRTIEWGLEQRHYDAANPPSLVIDSDQLSVASGGGAQIPETGAYDPNASAPSAILAALSTVPSVICDSGPLAHVGTFRVRARVRCLNTGVKLRLSWRDGDGSMSDNTFRLLGVRGWNDVDLGTVTIKPAALGQQTWFAELQGIAPTAGNQVSVDYLLLIPCAEGYGRARGPVISRPGVVTALDTFDTGSVVDLNGRPADLGGNWATSGAAGDFRYDPFTFGPCIARDTVTGTPRFAVIATAMAEAEVRATITTSAVDQPGLLARYVDASNYLRAVIAPAGTSLVLIVTQVLAGAATELGRRSFPDTAADAETWLKVAANGTVTAGLVGRDGLVGATSAALATGGALASGHYGLYDGPSPGASIRTWDNVSVSRVPASPPALYAGRKTEFRSSGDAVRLDAAGTVYGQVPLYRGGRFVVPASGDKNRVSRILVRADRNDLDAAAHEPLGDNLSVEVRLTPRYLVVGA